MNIIFVTQELPPGPAGGAGFLVARTRRLLEAGGHRVRVVVAGDFPQGEDSAVTALGSIPDHRRRSQAVADAVGNLTAAEPADIIEFQDLSGIAFDTLLRRNELGLGATRLVVRFHGPTASIIDAIGYRSADLDEVVELERQSMAMADAVLVPTPAMERHVGARYGLERLVVAEPARAETPAGHYQAGREIVLYGKRSEVKGAVVFARAVAPLLDRHPELSVRFLGAGDWSFFEERSVTDIVDEVLERHRERVSYGPMPQPSQAASALQGAAVVVVPSLFETYCFAAHEVRAAGFPLVVADIDAFDGVFDDSVARFDGTPEDLERLFEALLSDPGRLQQMAGGPLPEYGDPLAAYRGLPPPRHPQGQAGLATKAAEAIEAVAASRPGRSMAQRLLRWLPEPAARLAVRMLPAAVKDRFRSVASWPQEAARRDRRARHERARRQGVTLPETTPRVTVVIPCFEQGEWLLDAVASVYEQTFDPWEIVVVDDGSADPGTIDAVAEVEGFARVRVVRQENQGLPGARNAGIGLARGEFVVPLDADDELRPEFLATMVAALDAEPKAGFAHCWAELFGDISAVWVTRPHNLYQMLLSNGVVGCVVLRRQAWSAVGGYDETMTNGNEDWELWVRLLLAGWTSVEVREPLFRYRKHGGSMSTDTEARFEQGRADIVERHRATYDDLDTFKRGWYPAVSIIVTQPDDAAGLSVHETSDCEVLVCGFSPDDELVALCRDKGWRLAEWASLEAAVGTSRGKYLTVAGDGEWSNGASLLEAAERLEAAPAAYGAGPGDSVVLWRRWAVIDGTSPHTTTVEIEGVAAIDQSLSRGGFVDPAWELPPLSLEGEVQRQSPEVEGFVPVL